MQHSSQHNSVVNSPPSIEDFAAPIFVSSLFRYYDLLSYSLKIKKMQHSDQHISIVNSLSTDKDFAFPVFVSTLFKYYNIVSFFDADSVDAFAFKDYVSVLLYRRERRQFIHISYSVDHEVVVSCSFTADESNDFNILENYLNSRPLVTFNIFNTLVVSNAFL